MTRGRIPCLREQASSVFAKMLQQALGDIDGGIEVPLLYLFQISNHCGLARHHDPLLENRTENFGRAGMLATAIALNLEDSPAAMQEGAARPPDGLRGDVRVNLRAYLSGGAGALATNSEGIASRVADGMRYMAEYLTGGRGARRERPSPKSSRL